MKYAIFSRHSGALLWAGKADSRRAALAELAGDVRLNASETDGVTDWADVRTVSDELLPFLDNAAIHVGVHVGVIEADAIMATLDPALRVDIDDALIETAEAVTGAPLFYYTAEDTAGNVYQLAWQPAIRSLAVWREDRPGVEVAHGEKLIEALVDYLKTW